MLSTSPVRSRKTRASSAATVRQRLLQDQTMRRNTTRRAGMSPLPASPITATFPALFIDPQADAALAQAHLSPRAQHAQAIQIARSFKEHYLAEIRYCDERKATIAIIRPIHVKRGTHTPHEICVDSAGNVNLYHLGAAQSPAGRIVWRLVLAAAALSAALGMLTVAL